MCSGASGPGFGGAWLDAVDGFDATGNFEMSEYEWEQVSDKPLNMAILQKLPRYFKNDNQSIYDMNFLRLTMKFYLCLVVTKAAAM